MRRTLPKIASTIAVLILFNTVTSGACRNSDFECFKRAMMPKVGRKVTVEGVLMSAKLGGMIKFKGWGIYIYSRGGSDNTRENALYKFVGRRIKVTGTLH